MDRSSCVLSRGSRVCHLLVKPLCSSSISNGVRAWRNNPRSVRRILPQLRSVANNLNKFVPKSRESLPGRTWQRCIKPEPLPNSPHPHYLGPATAGSSPPPYSPWSKLSATPCARHGLLGHRKKTHRRIGLSVACSLKGIWVAMENRQDPWSASVGWQCAG
jgi:hypothetical protein